jgi:hypothetical protein
MNKIIMRSYSNGEVKSEKVIEVTDEELKKVNEFFDKIRNKKKEMEDKVKKIRDVRVQDLTKTPKNKFTDNI